MDALTIKELAPIFIAAFAMITSVVTAYFAYKGAKRTAKVEERTEQVAQDLNALDKRTF